MNFTRKISGSTNDLDVPGGFQTIYFKKTRVVAPEMLGLTCRVGAHISCYAHDTRLYPILRNRAISCVIN